MPVAKKSRTPPPPKRPVQAPKRRAEARTPSDSRTRLYVLIFAASGIVLLGAALAIVALAGGGGKPSLLSPTGMIRTHNCVETAYPGLQPAHINNPDQKVKYNSFPPSSGPHYQQWAPWGIYDKPIKQTILVHNLEHGGMILQYGNIGQKHLSEVQSFFQDDPYGLVVAPYPNRDPQGHSLGTRIAATAWNEPAYTQGDWAFSGVNPGEGHVLMCTHFDKEALTTFRDLRRGKAGERFPVRDLVP